MKEKKENMEKTIQTTKCDNEMLMNENNELKRRISGYKTSNANYRRQIAELTKKVEDYGQCLESKSSFIELLQNMMHNLKMENAALKTNVKELNTTIENLSKPWWKKLF